MGNSSTCYRRSGKEFSILVESGWRSISSLRVSTLLGSDIIHILYYNNETCNFYVYVLHLHQAGPLIFFFFNYSKNILRPILCSKSFIKRNIYVLQMLETWEICGSRSKLLLYKDVGSGMCLWLSVSNFNKFCLPSGLFYNFLNTENNIKMVCRRLVEL